VKLSHLDYIANEYDQSSDERGVFPISKSDVDIIYKIISRLQLTDPQLANILTNWKLVSDKQLLSRINQLRDEVIDDDELYDDEPTDNEKQSVPCNKDLIEIAGSLYDPNDFFCICKADVYTNRQIFQIKINHIDDKITSIKGVKNINVTIDYYSEQQRDRELDRLKQRLADYRSIRFL